MDKTNTTENLLNGQDNMEPKVFTTDELNEALYHLVDICDRSLIPYILLDETARSIVQDTQLKGERISIGVREADMTEGAKSTLKTLASPTYDIHLGLDNFEELDNGYAWNFKGIPIVMQVIKRNYGFIMNPDYTFYMGEQYNTPNPIDKYLKAKGLVK